MDTLLTIDEVATALRVPVATVRFWRTNGTGPAGFRVGKRVLFRPESVEAFVREREAASK